MREPSFSFVGELGVWEFAGDGPTALLAHATGFHARCWDQIVHRLPSDWRVIAVDLRGHGRSSEAPVMRPTRWKQFGADLAAVAQALNLREVVGLGHSMGGHATAHAAFLRPETYQSLVLLDPVILPSQYYGGRLMTNHYARKRRNVWASGEEMFERFQSRPPFDAWHRETLHDYCSHALRGNALACDPDFEASIYEACSDAESNLHGELGAVSCPVLLMRSKHEMGDGEFDMNWSPCDPQLARKLPNALDFKLDCGHFIPMEVPDQVASMVLKFV